MENIKEKEDGSSCDSENLSQDSEVIKRSSQDILTEYITKSMSLRQKPIPIIQKISDNGDFIFINTSVSLENLISIAGTISHLIPKMIKKIYLVDNNFSDEMLSEFLA
jgi:hypothetical protein